jgi:uncharacterized protein (DUF58 family)
VKQRRFELAVIARSLLLTMAIMVNQSAVFFGVSQDGISSIKLGVTWRQRLSAFRAFAGDPGASTPTNAKSAFAGDPGACATKLSRDEIGAGGGGGAGDRDFGRGRDKYLNG